MKFRFFGPHELTFPHLSAHVHNPVQPGDVIEIPDHVVNQLDSPIHPHIEAVDADTEVTNSRDLAAERAVEEPAPSAPVEEEEAPAPTEESHEEESTEAEAGGEPAPSA